MSSEILEEVYFLLYSVCMGIIITFVYDMFRLLRAVIPHNNLAVAIEDIIFWIFTSVALFLLLYTVNNGAVRWFSIAGALLGMILYRKSLGQYMVVFLSSIIKKILDVARRVFAYVFSPIRFVLKKSNAVFMRILQKTGLDAKKAKNKLTDLVKGVKIALRKRKKPNDGEVDL